VWLGRPIRSSRASAAPVRADIQVVFQDPFASLDPTMSVAECVAEPLRALRPEMDATARAAAVQRALDSVGLDASFATRRSPTLSGGQVPARGDRARHGVAAQDYWYATRR
jgi:ABC-type microcin C transport system duplicated ATPase subunit YejF